MYEYCPPAWVPEWTLCCLSERAMSKMRPLFICWRRMQSRCKISISFHLFFPRMFAATDVANSKVSPIGQYPWCFRCFINRERSLCDSSFQIRTDQLFLSHIKVTSTERGPESGRAKYVHFETKLEAVADLITLDFNIILGGGGGGLTPVFRLSPRDIYCNTIEIAMTFAASSLISGLTAECTEEVGVQLSQERIVPMFWCKGKHTNIQEGSKPHGNCPFHILADTQHRRVLDGSYCLLLQVIYQKCSISRYS